MESPHEGKRNLPTFHTTDIVASNDPFTRDNGWTEQRKNAMMERCVSLIEKHIALRIRPGCYGRFGIFPATITVDLADHVRARRDNPDVPNNASSICATEAAVACINWGQKYAACENFHMVFDRGEPFRGHLMDRQENKKYRQGFSILDHVSFTEAASSHTPALQIADLYAWCVSQKDKRDFKWQKRLLEMDRLDGHLGYSELIKPIELAVELAHKWKLRKRKANP